MLQQPSAPAPADPADGEPLLIGPARVAHLLGISPRTLATRVDDGSVPPPRRIGRLRRWVAADVRAWVAAGCPPTR